MRSFKLFTILLSIVSINLLSQVDTVYYFDKYNIPCNIENHKRKVIIKENKKGLLKIIDSTDFAGNVKIEKERIKQLSDTVYFNKTSKIKYYIQYNEDSKLYLIKKYKSDKLISVGYSLNKFPQIYHGKLMTYYKKNGNIYTIAECENNTVIKYNYWLINGLQGIDSICLYPDTLASFDNKGIEGFRDFVQKNLKYPEDAIILGKAGRVMTQFVVMEDGSIEDIQVINDAYPSLIIESLRIISLSDKMWTPAKSEGIYVRTFYTFPIIFVIKEKHYY